MLGTFAFLSTVFVLFFLDFFDTTGTLTGIADMAGKRRADGSIEKTIVQRLPTPVRQLLAACSVHQA